MRSNLRELKGKKNTECEQTTRFKNLFIQDVTYVIVRGGYFLMIAIRINNMIYFFFLKKKKKRRVSLFEMANSFMTILKFLTK